MKETGTHIYFWGDIYSQWYPCEFKDSDGRLYSSSEQYMMYKKAMVFADYASAQKIMATQNPRQQKALGRKIKNFTDEVWDKYKFQVVVNGNYLKFSQNPQLCQALRSSGSKEIVEASPYDKVWGIGLGLEDERIFDKAKWQGENLLGKAIMRVREKLLPN